jgi:lipid-A-disaccharide synthase-like uncharacterized protein
MLDVIQNLLHQFLADPYWMIVGFAGETTFCGRFVLQWIVSEKLKRSHVPVGFWYMSLVGSIILVVYAVHRKDPVFALGSLLPGLIYARNLQLIFRHKDAATAEQTGELDSVKRQT